MTDEAKAEERPYPSNAWRRGGLEFGRVINFTDAVFAIALTLLIVSVGVPVIEPATKADDWQAMLNALSAMSAQFVSFFIAFILIGRYWMAHHQFTSMLRAIDGSFISLTLVYLAFVAFLPFPTALVGSYEPNPVSVLLFAACLSIISGMEVVLYRHAYRHDLLRTVLSPEVYRWGFLSSLVPVVIFLVTAPLAFVSTTLTLVSWLVLSVPIGIVMAKKAPADADALTLAGASGRTHARG